MSFKRLFCALMTISLCFYITAKEADSTTKKLLHQVDIMIDNGNAKKALKILSDALAVAPEDVELMTKRAELYVYMERGEESQEDLNRIMALDSEYVPAIMVRATLKAFQGELDSAFYFINKGLSLSPNPKIEESLHGLKGNLLMKMGEYRKAETALFKATRSSEVSMSTMSDLANVLNKNGKHDEAAMVLKETLDIFGHHAETYVNTGYISNQIGFHDEAIHYLEEALKIDPQNPYALANLAESYLRTGQSEEAMLKVTKSLANDNTNAYAFRIKGEIFLSIGETKKACAEFNKAIQMGYNVTYVREEIINLVLESCGLDD